MRLSVRRNVDLPQPDGPMKAVTVRGSIVERDVFDGLELAVVDVEVVDFDALGHGFLLVWVQRPSFGEKKRATRRAMRLSSMTMRMSVSAPAQARSR